MRVSVAYLYIGGGTGIQQWHGILPYLVRKINNIAISEKKQNM